MNVSDTKIVNYSYGSLYNTRLHIHFIHCKRYKIANTVYMFLCVCVRCAVCMCWVYIVSVICNWSQVNSLCLRLLAVVVDTLQCVHRTRPNPNLLHVSAYFAYINISISIGSANTTKIDQYHRKWEISCSDNAGGHWHYFGNATSFSIQFVYSIAFTRFSFSAIMILGRFSQEMMHATTVFINLLCICTVMHQFLCYMCVKVCSNFPFIFFLDFFNFFHFLSFDNY